MPVVVVWCRVGGDGTFSEAMNGVISDDRPIAPDLVLAQVPGGTSNELSRSFGQLPLADACRAIASGGTREIDVFRAEAKGYAGNQVTRYGFVLAIVGAAATISWRAQRVPLLKRLGPISYVLMTAFTSLTYSPRPYRIRIDDEAEQNLPMWSLMLCSFDGAGEGLTARAGRRSRRPQARSHHGRRNGSLGKPDEDRSQSRRRQLSRASKGLATPRDADHDRQRSSWSAPTSTAKASANCRCRSRCCRSTCGWRPHLLHRENNNESAIDCCRFGKSACGHDGAGCRD